MSNSARLPTAFSPTPAAHPPLSPQPPGTEHGVVVNHRKRPRASRACEACRERKTKCDQQCPCSRCASYSLECVYRQVERVQRRKTRHFDPGVGPAHKSSPGLQKPRQLIIKQRPPEPHQHENSEINRSLPPEPTISGGEVAASHEDESGQDCLPEGEVSNVGTPRLDGLNTHTTGTEFYGGSSNLAFLAKLFSEARKRATTLSQKASPSGMEASPATTQSITSELRHLNDFRSSLIDLMYSTDYQSPVMHRTELPRQRAKNTPQAKDNASLARSTSDPPAQPTLTLRDRCHVEADLDTEIEKIFLEAFFSNKHYIHPMLDEKSFEQEYQEQVRNNQSVPNNRRTQFLSLYYAVLALGAINSGPDQVTALARHYQTAGHRQGRVPQIRRSALEWASHYFDLAKEALGDIMEVSSLRTCQTLFMMTVFCQNALKPHACFMYSGNAVRTALAIGLAHKARSTESEEIKRTWWCIYSHEIEMCCSSGRLDSLMPPEHYSLPLPGKTPELGQNPEVAIIPVMVDFAAILKRASTSICSNPEGRSISEMSEIAQQLNRDIDVWKANLPPSLDFDTESLNDPVWAHKQKVVLKMRFHNARILINRRFIVASSSAHGSPDLGQHVDICLDAARRTILLIHSAFVNRIYLRTWWYCTTYTLYANMIILYLVLSESHSHSVRGEELIADVERSLEIFDAMKQVVVAQRCAELTKEMLTVAKKHQQELGDGHNADGVPLPHAANIPVPDDNPAATGRSDSRTITLAHSLPTLDWSEGLAQLYNPGVLEGVAFSGAGNMDGSFDLFADYTTGSGDERAITGPMQGIFEPFEGDVFSGQPFSDWV